MMYHRNTLIFLLAISISSLVYSGSGAEDFNVIAVRYGFQPSELEYQVLASTKVKATSPCFKATIGREVWIRVYATRGSSFTISQDGGWRYILETVEGRCLLWDWNGDGLFDAYLNPDSRIRFGDELVKVRETRGDPWELAIEHENAANQRRFSFKDNQFLIKDTQSAAREQCYSLPKSVLLAQRLTTNAEEMKSKISELPWQKSDDFGPVDNPIERELTPISHLETVNQDGAHKCQFQTIRGVPVEVTIKDNRVTHWKFGDIYSQEFVYGPKNIAYCSKFNVGPFEYSDRDGDGLIDAFYNSKADERIEIRPSSLVRLVKVEKDE